MAGSTIYIAPTELQVELHQECGNWLYPGNAMSLHNAPVSP